eukprot:5230613-Pyramimonas_sp.AAC.1
MLAAGVQALVVETDDAEPESHPASRDTCRGHGALENEEALPHALSQDAQLGVALLRIKTEEAPNIPAYQTQAAFSASAKWPPWSPANVTQTTESPQSRRRRWRLPRSSPCPCRTAQSHGCST